MQLMMDCAMHTNVNLQADTARKPTPKTPAGVWFGADPRGQYLFFGYDWGGGTLIGWSSNGTFHWRLVPHYTLGPIAW